MYYPYFRGKQNELRLLHEFSDKFAESKQVVPIIEPVKQNVNGLFRSTNSFLKHEQPFILVINPKVGDFADDNTPLLQFISDNKDKNCNPNTSNSMLIPDIESNSMKISR